MKHTRYVTAIIVLTLLVGLSAGTAGADTKAISDDGLYFELDQATAFIENTTDNPLNQEARMTFSLAFGLNGAPVPAGNLTAMSFEITFNSDSLAFVDAAAVGSWTVDPTPIESGRIKIEIYGNAIEPPREGPVPFAELIFHVKCQPENSDNAVVFDRLRSNVTVDGSPYGPPESSDDNWQDGTVTVADYIADFQIGSLEITAGYDQDIVVPVYGTTNFKMMALTHEITYDDTRLEFSGIELGDAGFEGCYVGTCPQPGDNPIVISLYADYMIGTPVPDPGTEFYSLHFKILPGEEWDGGSTGIDFNAENSDVYVFDGTASMCLVALSDVPPVAYSGGTVTLERYTAEFKAVPVANSIYVGGDYLVSYVLQLKNRFYAGMPEDKDTYRGNITYALDFDGNAAGFQKVEFDDSLHFRMNSDEKSAGTMVSLYQDWDQAKANFWGIQDELKDAVQVDFTYTGALPTSYNYRFITPFAIVIENPYSTFGDKSRVTDLYGHVEADSLSRRLTWEVEPLEIEMGEWYGTGGWSKYDSEVTGVVKMRNNVDLSDFQIDINTSPNYFITGVSLGPDVMLEIMPIGLTQKRLVPAPGVVFPATGTTYRTLATITYKPASGCSPGTRVLGTVTFTNRFMTDTEDHTIHTVGNSWASLSAICPTGPVIPHDSVPDIPFDRKPDVGLPDAFALHTNYPNPFNPSTRIQFDLPSACHVTLDVFNIAGQRIATLVDRQYEAGFHTVEWNGKMSDGQPVASGVYLYRISAGDFVETRKMMLLK